MEGTITKEVLAEQLGRLRALPFCPKDEEDLRAALREIRGALLKEAKSDNHLIRIMDKLILVEAQAWPAPAIVTSIARSVPVVQAENAPQCTCEKCSGTGRLSRTIQFFNRGSQRLEPVDISEYCSCIRGQWLRSKMKTRDAHQAASREEQAPTLTASRETELFEQD
jgi:hypothetical protein